MPTHLIRNLLLILLPAVLFFCSSEKELRIIPVSPYEDVSKDSQMVTNRYLFAVDGFDGTRTNKDSLDKFVLKKLPDSLLKDGQVIIFLFYEYEKGILDEKLEIASDLFSFDIPGLSDSHNHSVRQGLRALSEKIL